MSKVIGTLLERRRKFAIALIALLTTFVLGLMDHVSGSEWVTAVGLIVGLYGGAETLEGFAYARQGGGNVQG